MDASRAAAARLFERHHLTIYRYFVRMTGHRDLAQDLTQDLFVRVVRRMEAYVESGRELSWLFQIARNLLRDRQREVSRRAPMIALDEAGDIPLAPTPDVTLAVDRALTQLNPPDREVFLLLETVGLSYEEIATVTGLTVAAVRSRLHRARRSLADALALLPARPRRIDLRRIEP